MTAQHHLDSILAKNSLPQLVAQVSIVMSNGGKGSDNIVNGADAALWVAAMSVSAPEAL